MKNKQFSSRTSPVSFCITWAFLHEHYQEGFMKCFFFQIFCLNLNKRISESTNSNTSFQNHYSFWSFFQIICLNLNKRVSESTTRPVTLLSKIIAFFDTWMQSLKSARAECNEAITRSTRIALMWEWVNDYWLKFFRYRILFYSWYRINKGDLAVEFSKKYIDTGSFSF